MITKYKIYEAKFGNVSKIISKDNTSDLYKQLMGFKSEFKFDENLIDNIYLPKNSLDIGVWWYHNADHDIYKKVKDRSQLYSISEFNEVITKSFIYFFENFFVNINEKQKRYGVFLTESNLHLLVIIDYLKLFEPNPLIKIITILPQKIKYLDEVKIPY